MEKNMKCPVDNNDLIMSDRNGVEIDYCPTCRGVWLDRGELDKIIERSAAPVTQQHESHRSMHPGYAEKYSHPKKQKRKSSLLGEIFDF
ncbi:zf-TFIIB domain-containing protein [Pseudohalocynthiibacter sp. F2068]|jgi:uncharacterized protein